MSRTRRRRKTTALAKAAELSMAVPQVIALRTLRMMSAGASPSARDRKELSRMGTEKVQAFWESVHAMNMQVARASQEYALHAMRQALSAWASPWAMLSYWSAPRPLTQKQLRRSMGKIVAAGMGPVHKRATANARRLRRS
jgi:hypothetical protein